MNDESRTQVAFVASLVAVVVAGLALGVVYSASQAPVARLATALQGNNDYLQFQIDQFQSVLPQFQSDVRADRADAARLMESLIYAFENQDNPDRDTTKPDVAEAVNQARGRIAEWSQQ